MLFRQVSRQHNREIENEFHIFFTANFARKRSNLPRKVRYELSRGANCRAKDRSKLPCTVKYRSKDRAVPNNRCRENAANYRDLSRKYRVERNFFEKLRKARNFDEVSLHYFCTILYFECAKKDLFAMIRQLGPATLFCSFSAAETHWIHLLRILGKLVDGKEYSDNELKNLNWEQKCRLIQSDPVTCARHFDYQFSQFLNNFLLSKIAPLGSISDWFYRVEYQQRGSPHIHMLIWLEDAPVYGRDSDDDITSFIDQIIICEKPANDPKLGVLVNRQIHRHSQTCRKKSKMECRF